MALPQKLTIARMTDATIANLIDDRVGELETALANIMAITLEQNVGYPLTSLWGSRRQNSVNTPTLELTQMNLAADAWHFIRYSSPAAQPGYVRVGLSPINVDITVAGPVVNGRDQAAVFSPNSWVYFYLIDDIRGVNPVAGIVSAVQPHQQPILPSGYSHHSYAGAVRLNSGGNLQRTYIRGDTHFTTNPMPNILDNGQSSSETLISLASFIPPNATTALLQCRVTAGIALTPDNHAGFLRADPNMNHAFITALSASIGTGKETTTCMVEFPNVAQNLRYLVNPNPGSGNNPKLSIDLIGYRAGS